MSLLIPCLWHDLLFLDTRNCVREALRDEADFATIASLRMTCKREDLEIHLFFRPLGKRIYPGESFVGRCYLSRHYQLMLWGLDVYPNTQGEFTSQTSRPYSFREYG